MPPYISQVFLDSYKKQLRELGHIVQHKHPNYHVDAKKFKILKHETFTYTLSTRQISTFCIKLDDIKVVHVTGFSIVLWRGQWKAQSEKEIFSCCPGCKTKGLGLLEELYIKKTNKQKKTSSTGTSSLIKNSSKSWHGYCTWRGERGKDWRNCYFMDIIFSSDQQKAAHGPKLVHQQ